MIQRVIDDLFRQVAKAPEGNKYAIKFAFIQIYQDEVYDLLSRETPPNTSAPASKPFPHAAATSPLAPRVGVSLLPAAHQLPGAHACPGTGLGCCRCAVHGARPPLHAPAT